MCNFNRSVIKALLLTLAYSVAFASTSLGLSDDSGADLKWQCTVVQTKAYGATRQSPVVTGVDIQANGSLVAVVGDDHIVSIYDKIQGSFLRHLSRHADWVRVARFSRDGQKLVTAGNDGRIFVWDVATWDNPIELAHLSHAIVDLDIHPNGDHVAAVGFDSNLKVFSVQGRRMLQQTNCPCKDMRTIRYSPSGMLLAGAGRNGTLEIWDSTNGNSVQKITAHQQRVRSLVFVDDQTLISCGDDRAVKLHSIGTNKTSDLFVATSKLFSLSVLNQDLIAVGGTDNKVQIWNVKTRTRLGILTGHKGCVSCLDSDGNTLVSGSFDTKIRIWKISQDASLTSTDQPRFGSKQWQQRSGTGQFQSIK